MNKDQVEGATEQGKGKLKEAAGDLTGNKSLEVEGEVDQVKGKVQKNYGDAKEDLKDTIDKL
ncbi:CsbD family protein [Hydrogenophaga sp. PAMC20947]|uniref:CsbD family protein n=1 Tax=Hydrogenophaga sp. PAMC20947 TaxID=2565558 RepID=UPI00109DE813|nr:CsbD family protein [Hydrogenophaga sp. PAMC20947]QCB46910.1 CsbD family protein [Hydrogenophaga sp. PAMC20947]